MDVKLQKLGNIDSAILFYDPLRKTDSFIVIKKGVSKMGFVINNEIVLESNFDIPWKDITIVMGGFNSIEIYQKIKDKIIEQVKPNNGNGKAIK